MNKSGTMAGYYMFNGVQHHVGFVMENGKCTSMYDLDSSEQGVFAMAIKITSPSKLANHYAQINGLSLPTTIKVGDTLNDLGYLTDGKTAYVDFDVPCWIFDDPDNPGSGQSNQASFNVVESIIVS